MTVSTVTVRRDLLVGLLSVLAGTFTTAVHPAQVATEEHLGICSVKGCSPQCGPRRALLIELTDVLGFQDTLRLEEAG